MGGWIKVVTVVSGTLRNTSVTNCSELCPNCSRPAHFGTDLCPFHFGTLRAHFGTVRPVPSSEGGRPSNLSWRPSEKFVPSHSQLIFATVTDNRDNRCYTNPRAANNNDQASPSGFYPQWRPLSQVVGNSLAVAEEALAVNSPWNSPACEAIRSIRDQSSGRKPLVALAIRTGALFLRESAKRRAPLAPDSVIGAAVEAI